MKKSRFTESQIVKILKEYEEGYYWKKKYKGIEAQQLKEYKTLHEENRRLKQMYADLSLDHRILKDIIEKKL
jgi:putative transposase